MCMQFTTGFTTATAIIHLSDKSKINTKSQSKITHPFFRQVAPKGSPEALDGMEPLLKFHSHSDYRKDQLYPNFFLLIKNTPPYIPFLFTVSTHSHTRTLYAHIL